jgi:uncharacterized membrane protein YphA (DoxX/SURF4 family)
VAENNPQPIRTNKLPREVAAVFDQWFREKLAPMTLRLAVGLVSVYHGYLKIMAAGGTAWSPDLSVSWQLLLSWGEFCAGVAILVGFQCRLATTIILAITVGAVLWRQGWRVLEAPVSALEPLLLITLVILSLLFLGAGEFSLDGRRGGRGLAGGARKRSA